LTNTGLLLYTDSNKSGPEEYSNYGVQSTTMIVSVDTTKKEQKPMLSINFEHQTFEKDELF
jgi:hypothetical protein